MIATSLSARRAVFSVTYVTTGNGILFQTKKIFIENPVRPFGQTGDGA